MDLGAHRRTTSVDSSYSAFFTSGLLSPPSSPAMSPTSPTSLSPSSTFPFTSTSPFTNYTSSYPHANKLNVTPNHPTPSTSILELASPASAYSGDALYFVALLQQMEDDESTTDVRGELDQVGGDGVEGEEENGKDLRELTSFLSLDASSASQSTRSTSTRTGGSGRGTGIRGSAASSSSTPRSTRPASPSLPSHSPRSPAASTSSTSTSTSTSTSASTTTSASVSPITPPSYPFSQHHHQQHHPYHAYHPQSHAYHPTLHAHPYHSTSNSSTPVLTNSHNCATITKPNANTNGNADADGKNRQTGRTRDSRNSRKTNEHPRSFLPSLRHHSPSHSPSHINTLLSPPPLPPSLSSKGNTKGNTHTPTRIPSLTLPPPIVSSFVFDGSGDSDSDSDIECDVSHPSLAHPAHQLLKRIDTRRGERDRNAHAHPPRTARTGAHTAPLLASFPAPPPTSLALRLSLHLPKTSLFFDEDDVLDGNDLAGGDGEGGQGEGARESYLSLTSPTSPPPHPRLQRQATRKPAHPPSHTRRPSTARRTVGSRKSSTRRTRPPTMASALSPALSPSLSALSRTPSTLSTIPSLSTNPFTQSRSLSTKAKWRFVANGNGVNGKRFTQVSTTSSASVSTGYRTCMRADALAALEGRVFGSRECGRGGGGGGAEDMKEGKGGKDLKEGGERGVGEGGVLMSTWSDEEDGEDGEDEDLWEDDLEEEQDCDDDLLVDEARREGRGEMSWMDFNRPTSTKSSKWGGLSSKSYKWKSMYSMYSTSTTGMEGMMGGGGEGEDVLRGEGRPFSASSTSLPNLPFPSTTSTSTFPSTLLVQPNRTSTLSSIQTSTLSSQTIELDASSPTSTSSATAMLSPLSYTESFALRALSFALPPKPHPSHPLQSQLTTRRQESQPQPLASLTNYPNKGKINGKEGREGREKKERGKGMTSFMFIDADERTARRTRDKGGFGKSFIDF
ncbi:hypothetical protein CCMSSC00406_0007696 [Pleurotus cornucopiae]|uniref:Uncharacterized protein n=1 Tax=Pleurotus cornucopiae TaxID=5321 RepID=A0ACB7J1D9_PLECO|nr:hypothetical protein CCMSSC00406_0007696 [Pleurotus cornucopiae]